MKKNKNLLKIFIMAFFIFMGNFYYNVEARSSSSRSSSSRSSSSSSRSSSSRSSSSSSRSTSSKSSGTSSKSTSSKSSGTSSKSASSKSSGTSSKSASSKSSSTSSKSTGRSNLDTNKAKNYAPKESKNLKTQSIDGKKIKSKDIEDAFEGKGINPSTTRKYYYPNTYRRSILDNPFVRYYLVYNLVDDTIDMVTDRRGYKDEQIVGVVSNEDGEDEIIMFEEQNNNKWYSKIFTFKNILISIFVIIVIWIYLLYRKSFK